MHKAYKALTYYMVLIEPVWIFSKKKKTISLKYDSLITMSHDHVHYSSAHITQQNTQHRTSTLTDIFPKQSFVRNKDRNKQVMHFNSARSPLSQLPLSNAPYCTIYIHNHVTTGPESRGMSHTRLYLSKNSLCVCLRRCCDCWTV